MVETSKIINEGCFKKYFKMNNKNLSIAQFKLVDQHDDIVIAEFPTRVRLDLDTAIDIVSERLAFTNNKKHYLIIYASNIIGLTSDAKKYLQKPEFGLKNILGAALIASNPVSALIANIFIKTPADFQSRFFSRMDEALKWICEKKLERNKTEK